MGTRRDEQAKLIADQQATIAELRALVSEMRLMLEEMRATASAREAELTAKLEALARKAFGKTSEKMPSPKDALRKKDQTKADPAVTQQKRKANEARKAELATEIVQNVVPEEQRSCSSCAGVDLQEAEPRSRIDYDYVPGYFRRRVHQQEVLVCRGCKAELVASVPGRPFEKSPYGAGLVAHVVVQKCACSVPIGERQGSCRGRRLDYADMRSRRGVRSMSSRSGFRRTLAGRLHLRTLPVQRSGWRLWALA